jgi:putative endonuclease
VEKRCYVYIMANPWTRVLYTGMTCKLDERIATHKSGLVKGFTSRYGVSSLVYVEEHDGPTSAIEREKQIKKYRREKKIALIDGLNPDWRDLSVNYTEE